VDRPPPQRDQVTGLILAGGRGSRMGGVDKGLQPFRGQPLIMHALQRLQPQVASVMINANRNLGTYESLGAPVWPDGLSDYPGPLAGFMTGLEHCETEWLMTVPCDAPLFPADVVARLAAGAAQAQADVAIPRTVQDGGEQVQPVFCLMRRGLRDSLAAFLQAGERKIETWVRRQAFVEVPFHAPGDERAFFNANTLDDLKE
jgi:molybdopterin-guanine dinucleotide biosynthesis protein A